MKKSLFLKLFLNRTTVKLLDFLLENSIFKYPIIEICDKLEVGTKTIFDSVETLKWLEIIVFENEIIRLNNDSEIVKKIKEVDFLFIKKYAEKGNVIE